MKKYPFQADLVQRTRWPRWLSAVTALAAVWASQPWPAIAAERTVLCEEFSAEL
jgi:hypothetical protein